MQDMEAIKDHFNDNPEVRDSIAALEKALKMTELYGDLAKHDAIKLIIAECEKSIRFYEAFLMNQGAEKLASAAEVAKRAKYEGYREAFDWFRRLFTTNAEKNEVLNKKVEELRDQVL